MRGGRDSTSASLRRENAELRAALRQEWWRNHTEHCDTEWPHPAGASCSWPLPEILKGSKDSLSLREDSLEGGGPLPEADKGG